MKTVLKKLNLVLERKQKKGIFLLFLGAFFIALLDTASVSLMAPFMTFLTNPSSENNNLLNGGFSRIFHLNSASEMLAALSALFILLYLVRGACKIVYNFFQARLIALYRTELSIKLFSYVMHKPYDYHLHHNTAETQRLVNSDVGGCFALIDSITLTVSSGLLSLGIFAVLLMLNWRLTLALVFFIGLFLLFVKNFLKRLIAKMADASYLADSEMNKWVSQTIGGLKTVLVKRKQDYYVTHYGAAAKNAAVARSNFNVANSIPKIMIDTICMVMVFAVVLTQIVIGNNIISDLPVFATFSMAALRLVPVIGQVTSTVNAFTFYRPSLNAIYEVLRTGEVEQEEAARIEKQESERNRAGKPMSLTKEVCLSHISFRYSDMQTKLFNDLNLVIPAKKSVAFVGVTGSGKTTLADIILGLHEPNSGAILVDGQDTRQNPMGWADLIGYIPQFIYLCDDTIRANVALGDEKEQVNDTWVWDCLERAQMKEFVQSLPDGLDTVTGENGIRLSGGQRQRIGIARALYCKPQFLLMDEATSSLDGDTEKAIVDSINSLSGDMTMLIIAHRLSTIESCDIVYKVENGRAAKA